MDLQFEQKQLFETLLDIDQAELSGALIINNGNDLFYTYFRNGYVVFAVQVVGATQRPMELNRRQAIQLGRIPSGVLRFDGSAEPPLVHEWQMRAADLILEAARACTDEEALKREIGDLRQVLPAVFDLETRTRGLLLTPTEAELVAELNVPTMINQLITKLGKPIVETLRSIHALRSAGILDAPHATIGTGELQSSSALAQEMKPQMAQKAEPVRPTEKALEKSLNESRKATKINTAKLQQLAGVKIRSMSGGDQQGEGQATSESEQFFHQGKLALKSGNVIGAEALFRKALEIAPEHTAYLYFLGRLLARQPKKYKEAEGMLIKACGNDLTGVEPRLALADLYEAMGNKEKVETLLNSVLKVEPDNEVAKRKLAEINKGSSWALGGLLDKLRK